MALTPEDVSNKRFTTVRLREGYDMTEVDQFLDEVEAELERMTREADELRAKLHSAQTGDPMPEPAPRLKPARPEPKKEATPPVVEESDVTDEPDTAAPAGAPVASVETLQVTTTAEASIAATRLLELAGNNADTLVLEAREQAEQIVGEAKSNAETLEAEAKERAEALEAETAERRAALMGQLEEERSGLDSEIERLRTFEREYRAELRTYFEEQLASLDGQGSGGHLGGTPVVSGAEGGQQEGRPEGQEGQEGQETHLQAVLNNDENNNS
jgi:DivIVA domain-containing protein